MIDTLARGRAPLAFFGELIVRLQAPHHQLLAHSAALDVHPGGAEANLAIALSSLGHACRMITRIPANALGQMAIRPLMAAGVDCRHVAIGAGRMAFYFMSAGAGLRASEIVYDRSDSAFARATPDDFDWNGALAGVGLLHMSGITPALGPHSADLARAAMRAARDRGIRISFDGNYRQSLWQSWDSDPRAILRGLIAEADIFFGNHRDIGLLLQQSYGGDGEERRREAAEAAFEAFPHLQLIASTARHVEHVDCHRLSARIDTPAGFAQTDELRVSQIVDRIGSGDAFAAGVLHGLLSSEGDIDAAARTGLALAALKHSLPGDAAPFTQSDIDHFLTGGLDVRR